MPLVVGEALSVLWQEPPVSIECTASCGKKTSALDHLPESVAGAAVFDPMLRVGPVVEYLCRSLEAPCGRSPNTSVVR